MSAEGAADFFSQLGQKDQSPQQPAAPEKPSGGLSQPIPDEIPKGSHIV